MHCWYFPIDSGQVWPSFSLLNIRVVFVDAAAGDIEEVPEGKCRIEVAKSKDVFMVLEEDVEMVGIYLRLQFFLNWPGFRLALGGSKKSVYVSRKFLASKKNLTYI